MHAAIRAALYYWFFACVFLGAAEGYHMRRCPNDVTPPAEWMAELLTMPAVIGFAIFAPSAKASCRLKD
jgi:hypothetical protein